MSTFWLGLKAVPELITSRLILREIREEDFPPFLKMCGDPRINEQIQLGWEDPAVARELFESFRARLPENRGIRWSILTKDQGTWVGNFGFHHERPQEKCIERGLQILPEFWRKGYGAEASRAAMDWLRSSSHYEKVDAFIASGNDAAIALIERQGFKRTSETELAGTLTLIRFVKSIAENA